MSDEQQRELYVVVAWRTETEGASTRRVPITERVTPEQAAAYARGDPSWRRARDGGLAEALRGWWRALRR